MGAPRSPGVAVAFLLAGLVARRYQLRASLLAHGFAQYWFIIAAFFAYFMGPLTDLLAGMGLLGEGVINEKDVARPGIEICSIASSAVDQRIFASRPTNSGGPSADGGPCPANPG